MEALTLAGKKFLSVSQSLPANQDEFILAKLRRCGAMDVLTGLDGVQRTDEQRAEDLLTEIMEHGMTTHVLAGCLTEEGKEWNREDALANAALFGAITDPDEKLKMRAAIVKFVIGFFRLGEPSSGNSPKSSSQSERVPRTKSAARATSATSRS